MSEFENISHCLIITLWYLDMSLEYKVTILYKWLVSSLSCQKLSCNKIVFAFFDIDSYLPYDMLLSYHTIGITTRTLVVPMCWFIIIFPFWDVSTVNKRTWSNQDIQTRPLVLTTVAPYKSVSNKISHVWILCNLTLTSFFSCQSRTVVDSFTGLMDPSWSIDKFFFSRMIGMSLLR
jgi:hypothetical protein